MSSSVVAQELTLIRIAVRFRQVVLPHLHTPELCAASITRLVRWALPNATMIWLSTTSLRI